MIFHHTNNHVSVTPITPKKGVSKMLIYCYRICAIYACTEYSNAAYITTTKAPLKGSNLK